MKRALVFSGGGSRGAYEIGAWQAMEELGVRFDGVYGTSIGALNAALAAQGDVAAAIHIWENIRISQIMEISEEEDFSIDRMVQRKRDVIPFLLENAKYLRMDITPLENLVRTHIDEGRIRSRGMELGLMTCRVPQLQAVPMRIGGMKPGSLGDWVIASASCFPVFPVKQIEGQRYIDGGYIDNLPIAMAVEDGADEVAAVQLHPDHIHPEYARMPWLKTIMPLHNLGGFLDFDPKLMRRSRLMGYYDAMKAWNGLDGHLYTFRRVNALGVSDIARKYAFILAGFDAEAARRLPQMEISPLTVALEAETRGKHLEWKDVYLRGLELCAHCMGFREDALYEAEQLIGRMLNFAAGIEGDARFEDADIREAGRKGSRYLTAWLYRGLMAQGGYPQTAVKRLCEYPAETAAALFLFCLKAA
ncbi:MAG: patatin-like phospholipase family protein [Clostridia bacterium]|nr:patatin-like phospholipase family protein [Clostridia bacterium]